MHAADAAGGEDRDPGAMRAIMVAATVVAPVPPGGEADGQVGAAELGDALACASALERVLQPDPAAARPSPRSWRARAGLAHRGLDRAGGLEVLRIGHAVGDDGGFQRHHRPALGLRAATSGDRNQVIHARLPPHRRAAASTARRSAACRAGPASSAAICAAMKVSPAPVIRRASTAGGVAVHRALAPWRRPPRPAVGHHAPAARPPTEAPPRPSSAVAQAVPAISPASSRLT
jgi:hypothetical protein